MAAVYEIDLDKELKDNLVQHDSINGAITASQDMHDMAPKRTVNAEQVNPSWKLNIHHFKSKLTNSTKDDSKRTRFVCGDVSFPCPLHVCSDLNVAVSFFSLVV